jgi:hypothetical protein
MYMSADKFWSVCLSLQRKFAVTFGAIGGTDTYIYRYVCVYVCVFVCMYTYIYRYVCVYVCVFVCMYTYIYRYVCVYVCVFVCMYAFACVMKLRIHLDGMYLHTYTVYKLHGI